MWIFSILLLYVTAKNSGLILGSIEVVHNDVICFCKSFTSYTSCSIKLLCSFIPNIIIPPRLLAKGIPMKEIQDWLGHSTYSTTANIYAHLEKDTKNKSANVLSNTLTFAE